MPLKKGKASVSENISELHTGETYAKTKKKLGKKAADKKAADKQAVAIALSAARRKEKK